MSKTHNPTHSLWPVEGQTWGRHEGWVDGCMRPSVKDLRPAAVQCGSIKLQQLLLAQQPTKALSSRGSSPNGNDETRNFLDSRCSRSQWIKWQKRITIKNTLSWHFVHRPWSDNWSVSGWRGMGGDKALSGTKHRRRGKRGNHFFLNFMHHFQG